MPEPTDTDIGSRIREVRKRRGMTQRDLAHAADVSLSLIRKLEQGNREDTRLETARRIAVALRVPTTRLVCRDEPEQTVIAEPWRPLQQAVEVPALDTLSEEPSVAAASASLAEVRSAYFANELSDLSSLLVPLLRDVEALGDDPDASGLRAHLLQIAGSVLTQARQFSAAETALERALDAATDRLRAASIVTTWTWLLVRQGRLEECRQMAVRWADDVEPKMSRATAEDLAAWGWLLLQASSACLRDNRPGEAKEMMRLARGAATTTGRELPRGDSRLATWGPVTVAYKKAERGIVLDQPDTVLDTAEKLKAVGAEGSTEYHRHRLDVAKAHTMMRNYGEAVDVLTGINSAAPQWLANQRYAQDIMTEVIDHRRTLTPEMRQLADVVGVPM